MEAARSLSEDVNAIAGSDTGTAGVDAASLVTTGHALIAFYNSTFLRSQSVMDVTVQIPDSDGDGNPRSTLPHVLEVVPDELDQALDLAEP